MLSTLLDSTPKYKENLAFNGFVCAAPWAKGYLLSKRINLNRSGRYPGTHPRVETRSVPASTLLLINTWINTMRCCGRRLNCSARSDPTNISLRSRKDFQYLSSCWMTLCCEGMRETTHWRQRSHPTQRKHWRQRCWENIWCMSNAYSPTREYVLTHTIYPLHLLLWGHM